MYDIIGDVHGCRDELLDLLKQLGYTEGDVLKGLRHPEGRKLLFVGDLNDRGPDTAGVFEIAMVLYDAGIARFVLGNHDWKLLKVLRSQAKKEEFRGNIGHDLNDSLLQIYAKGPAFTKRVMDFLGKLPTVIETKELIVVHGAYDAAKKDKEGRDFNLFGETDGSKKENGYPKRLYYWRDRYTGTKTIVFGHDPLYDLKQREAVSKYVTAGGAEIYGIDYGAPFGGELAAFRFPEREIVTVKARQMYKNPDRKSRK